VSDLPRLEFKDHDSLTFEEPDRKRFRNLSLAFTALKEGGNMPCILNAANEIAVSAFLKGTVGFIQMPDIIEHTLENCEFTSSPDLASLEDSDRKARAIAENFINKLLNRK
jgi:1-deoxy-D-xylulose-5-phosphate reductoisomerase